MPFSHWLYTPEGRAQSERLMAEERLILSDLRTLAESGKDFTSVALQFARLGGQLTAIARLRQWHQQQERTEQSAPKQISRS